MRAWKEGEGGTGSGVMYFSAHEMHLSAERSGWQARPATMVDVTPLGTAFITGEPNIMGLQTS